MRPLAWTVVLTTGLTALAPTAPPAAPSAPAPRTPPAAADAVPRVSLDRSEAAVGQRIPVRLTGWPPGLVTVELCGSTGCAADSSAQTYVSRHGTGGVSLAVAAPPGGCPCQVRVRALTGASNATAPLTVTSPRDPARATAPPVDTPTSAPSLDVGPPAVSIVEVLIEPDRTRPARLGWPAWYGGPVRRTVVVRLRNAGDVPTPVALSVTAGRGGEPTGFVAPPSLPDLAAGEERVVRFPVELPAPTFGTYTVRGEVVTAGHSVSFVTTTSSFPWALPALLGLLVTALASVEGRRLLRNRRSARPDTSP